MFGHRENKGQRSFSPIYLAIFSGIILIILIINGLLEINRTKNGFYRLLEREAIVLIQHFEKNIEETLTSLQLIENAPEKYLVSSPLSDFFFDLEESIAEYLVDTAYRVDQLDKEKPLNSSDLQSFIKEYVVTAIEIYDSKGNLIGFRRPQQLIDDRRAISNFQPPVLGAKIEIPKGSLVFEGSDKKPDQDIQISVNTIDIYSADGMPVMGYDPHLENLFWFAGWGGKGMSLALAMGELLDEHLDREKTVLSPFLPGRFV